MVLIGGGSTEVELPRALDPTKGAGTGNVAEVEPISGILLDAPLGLQLTVGAEGFT